MSGVEEMLAGNLGYFWPTAEGVADLEVDPERGYARHNGEGWITIETLDESGDGFGFLGDQPTKSPEAIAAYTPDAAALLLEVQWQGHTLRSGRASTYRYRARTLLTKAPLDRLKSNKLLGIEAHFPGIGRWAGLSATQEDPERLEDGRLQSWSIRLEAPPDAVYSLSRGRELVLSTTWDVSGPMDRRILRSPVLLGCRAKRSRAPWDLLQPLLLAQDLISLAYGGFVSADGGRADMDSAPPEEEWMAERPYFWNGALMVANPNVPTPKAMSDFPLFPLSAIGGVSGIARWIKLAEKHHRATIPVVGIYRSGRPSPDVLLKEVANGMEYWVKVNRPAQWARVRGYPSALARKVGSSFSDWIGDADRWAKEFWDTNNFLKHEPSYEHDPRITADLASAGRYLLAGALLDRVAVSKSPSKALFQSHRTNSLGSRLRARYG